MKAKSAIKTKISRRSFPIAIEMRPLWRISLIVIAIKIVGGDKLYLDTKKLNILVWMLITSVNWDDYEEYLQGRALEAAGPESGGAGRVLFRSSLVRLHSFHQAGREWQGGAVSHCSPSGLDL
ncbi:hypothetical protein ACOJCM_01445 [Billgrantia sp. LNSP4103-1]|uniref:hypothetical protein n=1 Tax=Billgrantia sp. LNSP4103-1 TaxID=3410266 RepID=UPI00403FBDA7